MSGISSASAGDAYSPSSPAECSSPIWLLISLWETLTNPPRCQRCGAGHPSLVQAIIIGFLLFIIASGALGWLMMKTILRPSRFTASEAVPEPAHRPRH